MIDEFEKIWKEVVVALFKVISGHLSGVTDENRESVRLADVRADI
jgi:hypothetical protein